MAVSDDGKTVAAINRELLCIVHRDESNRTLRIPGLFIRDWLAVSPDGRLVAAQTPNTNSLSTTVWDTATGAKVKELPAHNAYLGFTPDGRWLITGSVHEYRFWRVGSWRPGLQINRSPTCTFAGSFGLSSDGRLMAIIYDEQKVRLIKTASGEVIATLEAPDQDEIWKVGFSPDGGRIAISSDVVRIWDLSRIRKRLRPMGLDWVDP